MKIKNNKIAFIAPQGQIVHGGLERYVQKLSQLLIAEGYDVTIFTIKRHKGKDYQDQTIEGVSYRRVPVLFDMSQRFKIWPALFQELYSKKFDIVQCFLHSQTAFFISWLAVRLSGAKFFVTVYGPPQQEAHYGLFPRLLLSLIDYLAQPLIRNSDKVFYRGIPLAQEYVKRIGVSKNKIVNSISALPQRYLIEPKKIKTRTPYSVLFNGRLHPHKGPQFIIEAASHLIQKYPEIKIWLVGPDHDYRKQLELLSSSLQMQSHVRFFGTVPEDKLITLMDQASCFVVSSVFEGLSQAMLKAAARETPIISSIIPSSVSVLENGRYGLLYPHGDIKVLAENIDRVFSHPTKYQLMTKKLTAKIGKFIYEKELPLLVTHYQ